MTLPSPCRLLLLLLVAISGLNICSAFMASVRCGSDRSPQFIDNNNNNNNDHFLTSSSSSPHMSTPTSTITSIIDIDNDQSILTKPNTVKRGGQRQYCSKCQRPIPHCCLCHIFPQDKIKLSTQLLILQHPTEFRRGTISTVPLLKSILYHCQVLVGRSFHNSEEVEQIIHEACKCGRIPLVLFPGPEAIILDGDNDDDDDSNDFIHQLLHQRYMKGISSSSSAAAEASSSSSAAAAAAAAVEAEGADAAGAAAEKAGE
ncbi:hypothetical protein ACHAWU_008035 [Discostella pseudostelligera]|uniref:tRNA-uridine aminocarboxypropyltransferase n=1 Tax=Discostella pseudostelligera TaxID=259834 RepID=A0ABD3MIH4_9STRA